MLSFYGLNTLIVFYPFIGYSDPQFFVCQTMLFVRARFTHLDGTGSAHILARERVIFAIIQSLFSMGKMYTINLKNFKHKHIFYRGNITTVKVQSLSSAI